MKKRGFLLGALALFLVACGANQATTTSTATAQTREAMPMSTSKIVFVNASSNGDGNTAKMGQTLLEGTDYTQLNLADYIIDQLGQKSDRDQLDEVLTRMEQAETIVIGTPVYWHSMSGYLKTFFDRFNELAESGHSLAGKQLYFFMQGSAPTELSIESTEYIIGRVAVQMNMDLRGMAANLQELAELRVKILDNYSLL